MEKSVAAATMSDLFRGQSCLPVPELREGLTAYFLYANSALLCCVKVHLLLPLHKFLKPLGTIFLLSRVYINHPENKPKAVALIAGLYSKHQKFTFCGNLFCLMRV